MCLLILFFPIEKINTVVASKTFSGIVSPSTHTAGIGTQTYAPNEQLKGFAYDEKVDIFPLGEFQCAIDCNSMCVCVCVCACVWSTQIFKHFFIFYFSGLMLFELLHPFSTGMERVFALQGARRGELPATFIKDHPKEVVCMKCECVCMFGCVFKKLFIYSLAITGSIHSLADCALAVQSTVRRGNSSWRNIDLQWSKIIFRADVLFFEILFGHLNIWFIIITMQRAHRPAVRFNLPASLRRSCLNWSKKTSFCVRRIKKSPCSERNLWPQGFRRIDNIIEGFWAWVCPFFLYFCNLTGEIQ